MERDTFPLTYMRSKPQRWIGVVLLVVTLGMVAVFLALGFAKSVSDNTYEVETPRGFVTCVEDEGCDWNHPRTP